MWKGTRVHVSCLCEDTDEKEMEETFNAYGYVNHVWFAKQPPWVAYVFFDKERYAIHAVKDLDGKFVIFIIIDTKALILLIYFSKARQSSGTVNISKYFVFLLHLGLLTHKKILPLCVISFLK